MPSRNLFLTAVLIAGVAATLLGITPSHAAALYTAVPVSDSGSSNSLAEPNSSRMVTVSSTGTIYVAYHGSNGVRVARSTNRGQSFAPSVQISTANGPVSIAVDQNGVVYVAYASSNEIFFSRSTDQGQSFSEPTSLGTITGFIISPSVDIIADAPYVYILAATATSLFVNSNSGVGAFSTNSTGLGTLAFSSVLVDPSTHEIFIIGDNPSLYLVKSTDHGSTFGSAVSLSGTVSYSTYISGFGLIGQQVYIAGQGSAGYLANLATGDTAARTFNTNATSQSRTLAVDGDGNVVDGYSNGTDVLFAVSTDTGTTFGTPTTVVTGSTRMELALNPATSDIIAAYEQDGQIFVNVYGGLLPGKTPTDLAITQSFTITNLKDVTLTIRAHNNGPNPVTGAVVSTSLPPALTGTSWSWTCVGTGGGECGTASGAGNLNQTLGALPIDGEAVFTVTGTLADWSIWTSTASIAVPGSFVDDNSANDSSIVGRFQKLLPLVYTDS